MSDYRIVVRRIAGGELALVPGSKGEYDLVDAVVAAAVSKGVGMLRSEAQVERAITQAFHEVLFALKSEVQPS